MVPYEIAGLMYDLKSSDLPSLFLQLFKTLLSCNIFNGICLKVMDVSELDFLSRVMSFVSGAVY